MKTMALAAIVLAAAVAVVRAEDNSFETARNLYASAAYEDALASLAHVVAATPDVGRAVNEYRFACLFALGRTTQAVEIAERMIAEQPLARLADASPRLEALYQDVRTRLLPTLVRSEYKQAKQAIDASNISAARPHLEAATQLLDEAQSLHLKDETLADLRVLVDGFGDLIRTTGNDRPVRSSGAPSLTLAVRPQSLPITFSPGSQEDRPYSAEDTGIVPPRAVAQTIPELQSSLAAFVGVNRPARAVYEVIVDKAGAVQEISVKQSFNSVYDALVIKAARRWKYEPATKDGTPVAYRQTLMMTLK